MDFFRSLDHLLVLFLQLLTLRGIDFGESPEDSLFCLISLFDGFFDECFPFLPLENFPFARLYPLFYQKLRLFEHHFFIGLLNPHKLQCVFDEVLLHHVVKGS